MFNKTRIMTALEQCNLTRGCKGCPYVKSVNEALVLLREQEPIKKGYWVRPDFLDCHCSVCGEQPEHEPGDSVPLYDYCPYCGAKMEVKWDEAD